MTEENSFQLTFASFSQQSFKNWAKKMAPLQSALQKMKNFC